MDTEGMFLTAVIEGSKASFLLRLVSFCCSGSPPQKAPRDSSPSSGEQRTAVRREEQPWKELGPGPEALPGVGARAPPSATGSGNRGRSGVRRALTPAHSSSSFQRRY